MNCEHANLKNPRIICQPSESANHGTRKGGDDWGKRGGNHGTRKGGDDWEKRGGNHVAMRMGNHCEILNLTEGYISTKTQQNTIYLYKEMMYSDLNSFTVDTGYRYKCLISIFVQTTKYKLI